jgi:hypothetical protein
MSVEIVMSVKNVENVRSPFLPPGPLPGRRLPDRRTDPWRPKAGSPILRDGLSGQSEIP